MNAPIKLVVTLGIALVAACSNAAAAPQPSCAGSTDASLTRERSEAALVSVDVTGTDCRTIAVVGAPIAAAHLDTKDLQQTAGRALLASFQQGQPDRILQGTVLATVVGTQPTGELLTNHHLLFAEGTLRTQHDVVTVTKTSDPCVVQAKAVVNVVDGSGELAGLSGRGVAEATLNFCGALGHATIYARVCKH